MACSREQPPANSAPSPAAGDSRRASLDSLQREVAEIAATVDGSVGFVARHLESGASVSLNGNERYPMRSVYKLPIALAILRRADSGELSRDSVVTVQLSDFVPNLHSPLRERARGRPVRITVDSLLMLAVAQSDNTASDVLLALAGGGTAVTEHLRSIGITDISVDRPERELAQSSDSAGDPRDKATPEAMAQLLVAVHNGRGLSSASNDRLLEIMRRSATGANRIRALLPAGTQVAHKTGTGRPMTNDAGLVTLPGGGQIAIVVFVRSSAPIAESERVIARMARTVYDFFSTY